MSERLALPQPYEVRRKIEIDSGNLLDYLMILETSAFKPAEVHFASILDLGIIEPFLRELHAEEKLGYIHGEKERETFKNFELELIKHPVVREVERERRARWQKVFEAQEPVERYRSIFLNKNDNQIYVTPSVHGTYTRVTSDTIDLFEEGHTPLFEIHTHPANTLFSHFDYARLSLVTVDGAFRALKGTILLCPDLQLLALATPETMLFTITQLDKFLDRYDLKKTTIGSRISNLTKRMVNITDKPYEKRIEIMLKGNRLICEEEQHYIKGLYSEEEYKRALDETTKESLQKLDAFYDKYEQTALNKMRALKAERNMLYILNELEIAREVNPKLYIATDFRHFKEFTA